jgi:hypothetical protein
MANQLEIEFSAGTDGLAVALKDASRLFNKFATDAAQSLKPVAVASARVGNQITEDFNKSFKNIVKGAAIGTLVANGIMGATSAIGSFLAGTVNAAIEQEEAINKLNQALRASGEFSESASSSFQAFAGEMAQVTKYGDDLILSQVALAKSFGATNEQAKNIVKAAANLSATFGGSLEERVQQLGKSLDGTTGKLGKQVKELQGLTEAQLKAGGAADFINSKFGDAAAAELNTYAGKLSQLKKSISELQESLGLIVVNSGLAGVFESITFAVNKYVQSLEDKKIAEARANGTIVETISTVEQLSREYDDLRVKLIDYESDLAKMKADGDVGGFGQQKKFIQDTEKAIESLNDKLAINRVAQEEARKAASAARADEIIKGDKAAKAPEFKDKEELDKEKAKQDALLAQKADFNNQLIQQEADFQIFKAEQELTKDTLSAEQRQLEFDNVLMAETAKVEAVRAAELEKAKIIKDAGARTLAEKAANDKADLANQKNYITQSNKAEKDKTAILKQESDAKLAITSNFLQAGLAISKDGSAAQKALAITAATISTYQGATNALADTRPAYLAPAMAASIVAIGLANVARIAGAKFASGGIVQGSSMRGDNIPVRVNAGEMILNQQQQAKLFDVANGNGGAGLSIDAIIEAVRSIPIRVEANGRELARLIRDEGRSGFEVF